MTRFLWVLLFIVVEATSLRVAVARQGIADGDLVRARTVPPVRISVQSIYQRWTDDGIRLSEFSVPVTVRLLLQPNLGVSFRMSQATAEGDGLQRLSGFTDAQLALDYAIYLSGSRLVFNLGVNVPTGESKLSDEAYETASQIGLNPYNFHVPHFGQGVGVSPGLVWATALTDKLIVGVGASYYSRGAFEPVASLPDKYHWGDEVLFTAGSELRLTRTLTLTVDAFYTRYEPDKIGGVQVYEAGDRLTIQAQVHKQWRRQDVWLAARYRDVQGGQALAGGALRPETTRTFPGLFRLSGHYRIRPNPAFRVTLLAEATRYEATFQSEQLDVYGLGLAPELSLAPALTVPLQFKYSFGDIEGLEAGLGVVVIL